MSQPSNNPLGDEVADSETPQQRQSEDIPKIAPSLAFILIRPYDYFQDSLFHARSMTPIEPTTRETPRHLEIVPTDNLSVEDNTIHADSIRQSELSEIGTTYSDVSAAPQSTSLGYNPSSYLNEGQSLQEVTNRLAGLGMSDSNLPQADISSSEAARLADAMNQWSPEQEAAHILMGMRLSVSPSSAGDTTSREVERAANSVLSQNGTNPDFNSIYRANTDAEAAANTLQSMSNGKVSSSTGCIFANSDDTDMTSEEGKRVSSSQDPAIFKTQLVPPTAEDWDSILEANERHDESRHSMQYCPQTWTSRSGVEVRPIHNIMCAVHFGSQSSRRMTGINESGLQNPILNCEISRMEPDAHASQPSVQLQQLATNNANVNQRNKSQESEYHINQKAPNEAMQGNRQNTQDKINGKKQLALENPEAKPKTSPNTAAGSDGGFIADPDQITPPETASNAPASKGAPKRQLRSKRCRDEDDKTRDCEPSSSSNEDEEIPPALKKARKANGSKKATPRIGTIQSVNPPKTPTSKKGTKETLQVARSPTPWNSSREEDNTTSGSSSTLEEVDGISSGTTAKRGNRRKREKCRHNNDVNATDDDESWQPDRCEEAYRAKSRKLGLGNFWPSAETFADGSLNHKLRRGCNSPGCFTPRQIELLEERARNDTEESMKRVPRSESLNASEDEANEAPGPVMGCFVLCS